MLCLVCSGRRPNLEPDPVKLSSVLVDDCLETVVDCARATLGRGFTEASSSHPILRGERTHSVVSIPGAAGLWVWFDARCALEVHPDTTDSRTCLTFYADREHRVVLRRLRGPVGSFRPFVVHADTLYYEWVFDPRDPPCFGVRFTVSRLSGLWLEEEKVLTEPSLEWGCWLLQLLLSKEVVRGRYRCVQSPCNDCAAPLPTSCVGARPPHSSLPLPT